jgi:PAS domain S-box-containing protein
MKRDRVPSNLSLELGVRGELTQSMHAARAARTAGSHSHLVQFYEKDGFLVDEVAAFLSVALRSDDAAMLIATPEHRAAITMRVQRDEGAAAAGALIVLDARETLTRIMVGGVPDEALFLATIGAAIEKASQRGTRSVRAFGEMVDLLCADGNPQAAISLEALWNSLLGGQGLALLCAYRMNLFSNAEDALVFRHICASHAEVRPVERPNGSADTGDQDPSATLAALQQKALALQSEIDRRNAVEQTLRRREQELSDFLENAAEGLHRVGSDGTILWANRAELEMFGYEPHEYIGHNIAEFYVDQSLLERILKRLCSGETLHEQAAAMRCKDGSVRHVLINSNGFFDNGRFLYTRCFTRDVTDRLEREHAEHERDSLLMQAPVAAALMVGSNHVIRFANPLFCEIAGRTDIVGRSHAEVFAGSDAGFTAILDRVLATGEPCVVAEHPIALDRRRSGVRDECFFKLNFEPLREADATVYGVMLVAVDISELVRGRRALERTGAERSKLLEALEIAARTKDEFLAMLGHELRNPLSPMVTALQLMKMRGNEDTTKEQAIIQRQVDHLIRLVDDLLDVSRITRGQVELRKESCEIAQILARAVEMASLLFEQRRHHLTIDVPARGLAWHGDTTRMAQVVANLLTNAARYTPPGGEVCLQARRDGEQIVISVKDNGRGLSPEVLPHVFELFFQGPRGVDRAEGGLGIGLALIKNLVELHGGTVSGHSDGAGRGSEFVVHLPATSACGESDEGAGQAQTLPQRNDRRRILLVDDNVDAADSLAEALRLNGHDVRVVYDPVAALHEVAQCAPDLALLDIGLPVMDGYELARQMRQKVCMPSFRLVAISGYGQQVDRRRSAAAGFDEHLVKPVDLGTLLELVGRIAG